jgi:hypothetical protein
MGPVGELAVGRAEGRGFGLRLCGLIARVFR